MEKNDERAACDKCKAMVFTSSLRVRKSGRKICKLCNIPKLRQRSIDGVNRLSASPRLHIGKFFP